MLIDLFLVYDDIFVRIVLFVRWERFCGEFYYRDDRNLWEKFYDWFEMFSMFYRILICLILNFYLYFFFYLMLLFVWCDVVLYLIVKIFVSIDKIEISFRINCWILWRLFYIFLRLFLMKYDFCNNVLLVKFFWLFL